MVYVKGHKRRNGVRVKGHYRRKPGELGLGAAIVTVLIVMALISMM